VSPAVELFKLLLLVAADKFDEVEGPPTRSLSEDGGTVRVGEMAVPVTSGAALVLLLEATVVMEDGLRPELPLVVVLVLVLLVGDGGCCFFFTASLKQTEHIPSVEGLP